VKAKQPAAPAKADHVAGLGPHPGHDENDAAHRGPHRCAATVLDQTLNGWTRVCSMSVNSFYTTPAARNEALSAKSRKSLN
jgi:hypothetical protein